MGYLIPQKRPVNIIHETKLAWQAHVTFPVSRWKYRCFDYIIAIAGNKKPSRKGRNRLTTLSRNKNVAFEKPLWSTFSSMVFDEKLDNFFGMDILWFARHCYLAWEKLIKQNEDAPKEISHLICSVFGWSSNFQIEVKIKIRITQKMLKIGSSGRKKTLTLLIEVWANSLEWFRKTLFENEPRLYSVHFSMPPTIKLSFSN